MEPLTTEQKRKVKIKPDPDAHHTNKKWDKLKVKQAWNRVTLVDPASGPVTEDCVRFVCIYLTRTENFS